MKSSGASAAPTVSTFITIAFAGSTTEPVISHSTRKVSAPSSSTASGSREPIAPCWSTNSAAGPVTAVVERRVEVADPRRRRPARSRPPGRRARRRSPATCRAPRSAGAATDRTPSSVADLGRRSRAPRRASRRRRADRDGDGRRAGAAEVALDRVRDDARALVRRDRRSRRPASSCTPEGRQGDGEHDGRRDGGDDARPAHDGSARAGTSGPARPRRRVSLRRSSLRPHRPAARARRPARRARRRSRRSRRRCPSTGRSRAGRPSASRARRRRSRPRRRRCARRWPSSCAPRRASPPRARAPRGSG